MPPPLSVVMPVHNGLPYLEQSISSILGQSFGDFEFVIGDDGSTDGSGAALAAWAAREPRIRLLRRATKSGLAESANWVVSAANAPLVAIAHSDDLWRPDRLARQIEVLHAKPDVNLVGTLWEGIDESGRRVRPGDYWKLVRHTPFVPFSHSSIMFRRSVFEAVKGYRPETEYWEDFDLYVRFATAGRVVVIPKALSMVRHSRASAKFQDDPDRVERAYDLMYRATERLREQWDYESLLRNGAATRDDKLNPLAFISSGSTLLWSGRSPGVIGRMRRRARLGFDLASARALAWVGWGTISPKSLRLFLRTLLHVRNAIARASLRGEQVVDWPRRPLD